MLPPNERPHRVSQTIVDVIAHIITEYDSDRPLTKRKLSAITYLSEREHREKHGTTLTAMEFYKYASGPGNQGIDDVIDALLNGGHIHCLTNDTDGRPRDHYTPCCKHCARETKNTLTDIERDTIETILSRHATQKEHVLQSTIHSLSEIKSAAKYTPIEIPV